MKKILLLIASAAIALAVNAAPQKVDFGKLPKNSQEFIQKNFPGEKVKAVEMDREASWVKTYAGNTYPGQRIVMMETTADGYKVALSDKTVLDFDKDGNFTKATK